VQLNQSNQPNEAAQPEGAANEISAFDLSEMPQPQLTGHAWRQRGTELVCESCPFTHSAYIPPGYQLYGIDDNGYPKFRRYF
jgi:hypothetical protein